MNHTLAIDYGSKYVGLALVRHTDQGENRVLYAGTLVVEPKQLSGLVEPRARSRRHRRTRRTHKRRLRRLAQALTGIPGADQVVHFCRRRGYGHADTDRDADGLPRFQVSRGEFFSALGEEVARVVPVEHQTRVLILCARHLNETCRRDSEIRPARYDNRSLSRCRWPGCTCNAPRAVNDLQGRLRQTIVPWMIPVLDACQDREQLLCSLDHWFGELAALGRANQNATRQASGEASEDLSNRLAGRIEKVFENLLTRVRQEVPQDLAERFEGHWMRYYRQRVTAIVFGQRGGRSRYCRRHSEEFVACRLAHLVVPVREEVLESDLSRRQAILFSRILTLVERRLLSLAGNRIDRVVVERVGFDLLGGAVQARLGLSDEQIEVMRREGPQFGFDSRLDMLRKEFGGRCAYCGRKRVVDEVEHVLPRSRFPFDCYLNILPGCRGCNNQKGTRTPLEAGLTVHADAFAAFRDYVRRKEVPHLLHRLKLSLLDRMQLPATAGAAERELGQLAAGLAAIGTSQRSPRVLGRYLATKLHRLTGQRPQTIWTPGRRTALCRSLMLPGYDKEAMKEDCDLRNHAVDAIVLGCDMPPPPFVARGRTVGLGSYWTWADGVRAATPEVSADGLPRVEPLPLLRYFEEDLGGGYRRLDLGSFNWNRRRKSTHLGDPFGVTAAGEPLQRKPASEVLAALKGASTRARQIEVVAHRGLRRLLQADPGHAAEVLVRWLQGSIRAGLANSPPTRHPADQGRRALLERFIQAAPEDVVAGKEAIPGTVGVRCVKSGSHGRLDVVRCDRAGRVTQRYHTTPVVRELHVGYRERGGQLDRAAPLVLVVTQALRLMELRGKKKVPLDLPADSPLQGRPHGLGLKNRAFLAAWDQAFSEFCRQRELKKVFKITQGCVIERMDGSRYFFKNFDNSSPWMTVEVPFEMIRRVYHSPLVS